MTTPDAPPVTMALPDLRAVRLDEMPALPQAVLDQVVRRVLPGRTVVTVSTGGFSSAL